MQKIISLILILSFTLHIASAQKIKGSDTCLPLVQKEAESYKKKYPTSALVVTGGGSGVGIAALMDKSCDLAMSSRPLKMDEKLKLQDAGISYKQVIMAYDALSVIVNPANKVSQLTRVQLEGIYTGKIKNWSEVGGDNLAIVVYSRESSSGTYEFFKEKVMLNKNYASTVLNMPATGAIVQSVSQTKGAIGYVGLAYMEADVKALAVSYDGKTFVKPSMETAINKTYPVIRPLYLFYNISLEKKVKPFVDYILSAEGQGLVKQTGYVPLPLKP
jgi:phosphate transport system substrate-binding protein